jgi:intracellular multiplication protein IcmC
MDTSNDSFSILINIANNLLPVQELLSGAAYVMGIGFAMKALMSLKSHGENRQGMSQGASPLKEPALYLVVAAMMIYFPTAVDIMLNTSFGSPNILSYQQLPDNVMTFLNGNSSLGRALVVIIQTIGLYAFVRGWVLVARSGGSGSQPGGLGKGLTHVFGGVLAINIVGTLEMIDNTLFGT